MIEFSNQSGLIKCTQNPQLYFHMCEVLEKKRLELNEKVEFSVVPVSSPVSDRPSENLRRVRGRACLTPQSELTFVSNFNFCLKQK